MNDLMEYAMEWQSLLPHIDYLGEIALTRSETDELLAHLKQAAFQGKLLSLAYSILAVNFAWHHYDDTGFWHGFCERTGFENNPGTQSAIGHMIETGFQMHSPDYNGRTGSYRYVSPILAQSGIGPHFIDRFASIFRHLKQFMNLERLSLIETDVLRHYLPANIPKALSDFLNNEWGCAFINDIAATILQLERGVIDVSMLASLPGYRSEFWPQFCKALFTSELLINSGDEYGKKYAYVSQRQAQPRPRYDPPQFVTYELGHPAPYVCHPDCYIAPIGKLYIRNAQGIAAGRFILLAQVNRDKDQRIRRIELGGYRNNGDAWIDVEKLTNGKTAEVTLWIEPLGRYAQRRNLKTLRFFVLEKYDIIWQQESAIRAEDGVLMQLVAPSGWALDFAGKAAPAGMQKWLVSYQPSPVRATLSTGARQFPVKLPVSWNILEIEGDVPILTSENYRGQFLELNGLPGNEAKIIIDNDKERRVCETGSYFGQDGKIRVNIETICGEELENLEHPWAILSQGTDSALGNIVYLNLPLVYRTLPELANWPERVFASLPENGARIRKLAEAMAGRSSFDPSGINEYPLALQSIAWHAAACAAIIEGKSTDPDGVALGQIDEAARYALEWYRWADYVRSCNQFPEEWAEYPDAESLLATDWIQSLDYLISELKLRQQLSTNPQPYIKEWTASLLDPGMDPANTAIGSLAKGSELKKAWSRLFRKRCRGWEFNARDEARKLENVFGPVGWLAKILLLVLLKICDREEQMKDIDVSSLPECFAGIAEQIGAREVDPHSPVYDLITKALSWERYNG